MPHDFPNQSAPTFQYAPSIKIITGNDYSNTSPNSDASAKQDNCIDINGSNPLAAVAASATVPMVIMEEAQPPPLDNVLDFNNLRIVKK
jgi:hypothetical protein